MSSTASELFHVQSNSAPPISSTAEVSKPNSGKEGSLESSIKSKNSETKTLSNDENTDHFPHIPAPCRIQSPKTRHEPPTNRMHQHNLIESLGLGKTSSPPPSLSPSLSLPPSKMPINKKRTFKDDDVPQHQDRSSNRKPNKKTQYNNQQRNKQKQQGTYTSAASLVVCGVDGTVFTLDAYTGQLRGMFASGPALVFSSDATPERSSDDVAASFDDKYDDDQDTSTSSIISSTPRRKWKERVVPGLDGRLYSLYEQISDEFNEDDENLQSQCQHGEMAENDDFLDELCNAATSGDSKFDGGDLSTNSLPKMDNYHLKPIPISVMDVVDSPISSCRPVMDFEETFEGVQRQQCGIMVGSKKTTIYAIDPMTGKVLWTQDPHGGGGAKGFTTGRPADARGKPTVLLQREDYAVRHFDADGGEEVWKVEVGRFSALDFDADAHQSSADRDQDEMTEDPVVIGGRRRGAAATAASIGKDKQRSDFSPILGGGNGRNKFGSFRHEPEFESDDFNYHDTFNYEQSNFRAFPSVAFGEDGTSIIAADGISGELLWKRQIESVVAAVYGVGKTSTWVPLDVIEESEVLTHGKQHGSSRLPSSASSSKSHDSGGLVPYGSNQMESGQLHRLGRHQNHLFVSSKFDSLGMDSPPFPEPDNTDYNMGEFGGYAELPPKQTPLFSQVPYPLPADVSPPVSHRTEHGLYLTWSMVSAIMVLLLVSALGLRVFYVRQKKKWKNTPTLAPATAPNSYEDSGVRDSSLSPRGHLLLPAAAFEESRLSAPEAWWKVSFNDKNTQAPARSLSLDALGCKPGPTKPFTQQKESDSIQILPLKPKTPPLFVDSRKEAKSLTGVTTASPTITRSLTVPGDEEPKQSGVDDIDGVPLVRYSRYRSEFKELSALGRGGFGTVFRCENALDSREYAIKKIWIKSQLYNGKVTEHFSQKLHRVLREVKILALLDHPNIVRYYTAWLEADDETKTTDEESSTSHSILSPPSIFSSFGSTSKGLNSIFKTKGSLFSKSNKGGLASYMPKANPLGWNNFGSFRLDESASKLSGVDENIMKSLDDSQDTSLGFVWERSQYQGNSVEQLSSAKPNIINPTLNEEDNESSSSSSGVSSVDSKESAEDKSHNPSDKSDNQPKKKSPKEISINGNRDKDGTPLFMTERKHVLYIQMQLCSVQTLADFLGNRQARIGSLAENNSELDVYAVDIPFALRLFSQIARGVKYVHNRGLIHRDLKPMNVFIDDAGNVKVGDFGLSRESSTAGGISAFDDVADETDATAVDHEGLEDAFGGDAENTAGVGTRAYASPEQMKGSKYDTSTDVFSLGLILFEMVYPLYTAHERYKEFSGIRRGAFPIYWDSHVKTSFPSLHDILVRMISPVPSKRPSAADVSEHIDNLLSEYQVQSLDKSWGRKGAILLRVETNEAEGVLAKAMKLIKAAAPSAVILQYGLRGQASKAIMEFAIEINVDQKLFLEKISSSLRSNEMIVRQISNQ